MPKKLDLVGKRFGRLTVIEYAGVKNCSSQWKCRCDCGKIKTVRGANLTSGVTRSCGCLCGESHVTHDGSDTRLYRIWYGIIRRTEDSNRKEYANYGGRGIKMCPEWRSDFAVFREWATLNGYNDSLSIDRIDPDGNYCPENCRWATKSVQERNKRTTPLLVVNGVARTAAEWSEISGISADRIRKRKRNGWSDKNAVFTPIDPNLKHNK